MKIDLNINKRIFNEVYYPYLLDYSRRYEVYYGGSGSGKSHFCASKMLIKALKGKRKVLIIRKYATTLKDSVFQMIVEFLKEWNLYDLCKINLTTYTVILPNQSIFLFKGIDDSEKIKSIASVTDIWIEEATELTYDDFTQLDLRLRALEEDLQILLSFNPVSKENWVYSKWFAPEAVYDAENTLILKTTYKDNKFLPEAYIKALEDKINTNPQYYKVYALGEFATLEGLVITNWRKEWFNPLELAQKGLEHRSGMDVGYIDATAILDTLYDRENKVIYVFNEFYKSGCQLTEIAEAIKEMNLTKIRIFVDSAEARLIDFLKQEGIKAEGATKGKGSVKSGIMFLQDHLIIAHPKCINFIMELENFAYIKNKAGEYTEDTTHEYSHSIDSLRYAYSDIYTNRKLKSFNKNLLSL